jgi:hypothetical protein
MDISFFVIVNVAFSSTFNIMPSACHHWCLRGFDKFCTKNVAFIRLLIIICLIRTRQIYSDYAIKETNPR